MMSLVLNKRALVRLTNSDLGLHCLLRPICPYTTNFYILLIFTILSLKKLLPFFKGFLCHFSSCLANMLRNTILLPLWHLCDIMSSIKAVGATKTAKTCSCGSTWKWDIPWCKGSYSLLHSENWDQHVFPLTQKHLLSAASNFGGLIKMTWNTMALNIKEFDLNICSIFFTFF